MAENETIRIKLLIAVFITLTLFTIVNNYWSYGSTSNISQLTLSELSDLNKGKTFSFVGNVQSIYKDKNDRHILKINSPDHAFTIESTIWPSIGTYSNVYIGNSVRITGVLGRYKKFWQLNPLSSKHIQPGKFESTDLSRAINEIGKELFIGPVIVRKTIIQKSKGGNDNLKILVHNNKDFAEGIIWENKWDKNTIGILEQNYPVIINAKVTKYRGVISLEVRDIIKIDDTYESNIGSLKTLFTNLEDAIDKTSETLFIGPVVSSGSKLFVSKKGGRHLKFKVKDNELTISGIIWQGKWDEGTRAIFDTQNPLYLKAKVTIYKNEPNLDLEWVISE